MSEEMVFLDLEIVDPPVNPDRDTIDADRVRELGESIRSQGLLQPILVRPSNGRYEIVVGHRRFLAHRLIGEVKIKSIVREMTDDQVFEARTVENDQREDLNPIERAKSYRRLRDKFNYSNRQIAQKVGRSPGVVDKYFHLLEIPQEFQDAVARKKIFMEVALCLNEVEDPEFKKFYFTSAIENGITKGVAEAWVNDWRKSRAGVAYESEGGGGLACEVPESLPLYQACVCCLEPKEISKLRPIYVCPECLPQIRGALKPK